MDSFLKYMLSCLKKLSRLEDLDLSGNYFNTSILSSLSAVSSLKSLSLNENGMEGPALAQGRVELVLHMN